jgi:hypothetical protein
VDYFTIMRSWGVDLVKIDNSSSVANLFYEVFPFDKSVEKVYNTEHAAAAVHDIAILNCLGPAHDAKSHWSYSNIARVSNDFGPGNFPGTKHQIHQCTMNPLQLAPFCWPDTDMFQSHGFADQLIYLHMISGGPIYLADDVGKTDFTVINRISFPDGRIPRLDRPAYPTVDIIFEDIETNMVSKLWNYHDLAGWGRIFYEYAANMLMNDEDSPISINLRDFGILGLNENINNSITEYILKEISSSLTTRLSFDTNFTEIVENYDYKYYCISPIIHGIALLGIAEVINGTKAIREAIWTDNAMLTIIPEYEGTLQLYAESPNELQIFDFTGELIEPIFDPENPNLLKIPLKKPNIRIRLN